MLNGGSLSSDARFIDNLSLFADQDSHPEQDTKLFQLTKEMFDKLDLIQEIKE